jgi:cytidine deaminase
VTATPADDLVARARAVAARAHVPISHFTVGCAIEAQDGSVHVGCNVENASYGLTVCAERNAVGAMVAAGSQRIRRVAVWTPLAEPASPCGACRQVLAELADDDVEIVLAGTGTALVRTTVGALLPRPFRFRPR